MIHIGLTALFAIVLLGVRMVLVDLLAGLYQDFREAHPSYWSRWRERRFYDRWAREEYERWSK